MIRRVGVDKNNLPLTVGDICRFKVDGIECIGMIGYEEDYFAFGFDIEDSSMLKVDTPCLLMSVADFRSIEKIINVGATRLNDEYGWYRKVWNGEIKR